ncbi:MAG: EF-P lysine aminoacylase EpmA [Bdellovibrionales bacterium]
MKYPAFDRKWKVRGRILEMVVEGPYLKLRLHTAQDIRVHYREEYQHLRVQDWVALDSQDRLVHVAPASREPRPMRVPPERLKKWATFLAMVRAFFEARDFLELATPSLVVCPGTEPTLESFETRLKKGSQSQRVFLPTSPELHLKKALAQGYEKIFEIAKCYRNGEITPLHQPEFWMLEWYRSFANLHDLQKDCVDLVYALARHLQVPPPAGVACFTIRQLFREHLKVELTPTVSREDLAKIAADQGLRFDSRFTQDDLFFLLMLEKIEPRLPHDKLVFVEGYPPFQAALARKNSEGWAERFELYWKGLELANAFDELNDPEEQRRRAQEDLQKREGRNAIDLDEDFFQALESGLPPSAGLALGLERLFMALMDLKSLEELRVFPVRD